MRPKARARQARRGESVDKMGTRKMRRAYSEGFHASVLRAVAVAALLLSSVLPIFAPETPPGVARAEAVLEDGVKYEWWNASWHMRLPVLILPIIRDHITANGTADVTADGFVNYPAQVEIDFTAAIRDAPGEVEWPLDQLGGLSSFTFDSNSVRVVWHSQDDGTIQRTEKGSDVVPSVFTPSLYENRDHVVGEFDPQRNAVGTVSWILEGAFDAPRLYFIYFDIVENGRKAPPTYPESEAGPLRALYWLRSGTEFFGYAPADGMSANSPGPGTELLVMGLYANTTIRFSRYNETLSGIDPVVQYIPGWGYTAKLQNMATGGTAGLITIPITNGDPFFFKLEATRPVLLAHAERTVTDGGVVPPQSLFYPATDGSPVGERFTFVALTSTSTLTSSVCSRYPNSQCVASYNFVAFDETASVMVTDVTAGPVASGPSACPFLSVPRQTVLACQLNPGRIYTVTTDRPIAIHSSGITDQIGYQAVSSYGAPQGTLLVGSSALDVDVVSVRAGGATIFEYNNPTGSVTGRFGAGAKGHFYYFDQSHEVDTRVYGIASGGVDISATSGDRGLVAIGGRDGREFELVVQRTHTSNGSPHPITIAGSPFGMIFGLYNETRLSVVNYTTGQEVINRQIGPNVALTRRPAGDELLLPNGTYRINASKPIFVSRYFPQEGGHAGFYAGSAEPPIYQVGGAEFWGYLLGFDASTRLVTASLKPGESRALTFKLQNLGRDIGGRGVSDSAFLSVVSETSGWKISLAFAQVDNIPFLEKREIPVILEVPPNATTGETATFSLVARSVGNPNMRDTAAGSGVVQTKFLFTMEFYPSGKKELQRVIQPGSSTSYAIKVKNVGTGDDTILFTNTRGDASGFSASLVGPQGEEVTDATGRPVSTVELPVGAERIIFFNVTAPVTEQAIPFAATVQGASESDASAIDQVAATTLINVKSQIRVKADRTSQLVTPLNSTTFPVVVANEGAAATIEVRFAGAVPPGWTVNLSAGRFPLEGSGRVDPLGKRLDERTVNVTIAAPAGGEVGKIVQIRFVATSLLETVNGTLPSDSVVLEVKVANNFLLDIVAAPGLNVLPAEAFSYEMRLRSDANGPFELDLNPARLPPGWFFRGRDPQEPQVFAPGETKLLQARFEASRNTSPGMYPISLGLSFSEDVLSTTAFREWNFTALVKRVEVLSVTQAEAIVVVAPGSAGRVELFLENKGNVNLSTPLSVDLPAGWSATFPAIEDNLVELEPGENVSLNVTVGAPVAFGEKFPAFALKAVVAGGEAAFPLRLAQVQYDLEVLELLPPASVVPGEPASFTLRVVNHGTVPATHVLIDMLVDGTPTRNATIESLPPEEPRTLTIPWTATAQARTIAFSLDPLDAYKETREDNNAASTDVSALRRTPTLGLAAIVGCLVIAAAACCRRR